MVPRKLVFLILCCVIVIFLLLNTSFTETSIKREGKKNNASFKSRLKVVQQGCKGLNSRKFYAPSKLYVEDKHRLLYCYVPKVACTNLKKMMLVLNGLITVENLKLISRDFIHEHNPLRRTEAYGDAELFKRGFESYFKFMFVRHPFERLVSAYYDKFMSNGSVYKMGIGGEILRRYRPNEESLSVTFPDFVTYVIDEWKSGRRKLDVHWRPMTDLCLPCSIKYDFIGKFETLNQDLDYLLSRINETEVKKLLFDTRKDKPATTSTLVRDSFRLLTKQQIDDLVLLYDPDFKMFSYDPHLI